MAEPRRCIRCKEKHDRVAKIDGAIGVYCRACRIAVAEYRLARQNKTFAR